ncbi:MAG: Mut7-C RNAse domain-containing protein [Candidatus Hodarchaeota archaeon]
MCDAMLGDLSRILRFFGFDTEYAGDVEKENASKRNSEEVIALMDKEILAMAKESGRIVLTKDEAFALTDPDQIIFLEGNDTKEYLRSLKDNLDITFKFDQTTSRCHNCNVIVKEVDKNTIKDKVKPKTYEYYDQFFQCPRCEKVYWKGSHFSPDKDGILSRFEGIIDE